MALRNKNISDLTDITSPRIQKERRRRIAGYEMEIRQVQEGQDSEEFKAWWTADRQALIDEIKAAGPLGKVVITSTPCNAKCVYASGHDCECACGGFNHGKGEEVEQIAFAA